MEVSEQIEILLVEDNPLDAEMTMRGLKDEKLANNIVWVKDGQQALDYIFKQGKYAERENSGPRLILLDLKMPRIDGIEVLRAIKADETTKRIPVVVMTSSQEESDIAASYELGANSYVVKPINFKSLMSVARQAGFYWLAIKLYADPLDELLFPKSIMAEDPQPQAPARVIRVLHAEDTSTDAELVLRQLKRHGLAFESRRVSTETGFREALAAFVPDIILSDYSMPEFDGLRALALVRDMAPGTPFMFVSGSIRPSDAADALKNGACDFVAKDDLTRLGAAVDRALRRTPPPEPR